VSGKRLGDSPTAASDPSAVRHVLRFEVTAETYALFREAMAELRRRSNASLDDDSALLEMARHVLVGPGDAGRSSYQIALSVCPACRGGRKVTNGQAVDVSREVVEMAHCDAQSLPTLDAGIASTAAGQHGASSRAEAHVGARATQCIPPALRRS